MASTQTDQIGRYILSASRIPYRLIFSRDGYLPIHLDVNWSEEAQAFEAQATNLEDFDGVVLLPNLNASLTGQLRSNIERFSWADTTTVRLTGDDQERAISPNADGTFEFLNLRSGDYFIEVDALGHVSVNNAIIVTSGANPLDEITLEAEFETPEQAVPLLGYALLDDQVNREEGTHLGILVQAFIGDALVASTQTDQIGRYILSASRIDYRLRFVHQGYDSPRDLAVIWRQDCGRPVCFEYNEQPLFEYLGADVLLNGRPAHVTGTVHLAQFETAQRLQSVDVELRLQGTDQALIAVNPNASGFFTLNNVDAGNYDLILKRAGYEELRRPISLQVDEQVDLGTQTLAHHSNTARAVQLEGRVRLADHQDHSGSRVEVRFSDTADQVGTALTDAEGRFTLSVSPDESYSLVIQRAGYEVQNEDQNRVYSWVTDQFVDGNGLPLDIELARIPLDGIVTVHVDVQPHWIPVEQRYVRVSIEQLNGDFQRTIERVTEREASTFNGVPAGRFAITLSRIGFQTVRELVELSEERSHQIFIDADEANTIPEDATRVGPSIVTRLDDLSRTQIDLDGLIIDACDLRISSDSQETFRRLYVGGDFSGATLTGRFGAVNEVECTGCSAVGACGAFNLAHVNLTNSILASESVPHADFSIGEGEPVDLTQAHLFGAQLNQVDLRGAWMMNSNLFGASASGAHFAGANLTGANLTSADLTGAFFSEVNGQYADTYQIDLDDDGLPETLDHHWAGLYRPADPLPIEPCTDEFAPSSADLTRANFAQANLSNAFLAGVNLSAATLADARIVGGDLRGTCLENSSLNLIDLSDAVLDHANLKESRMTNAIMYKTTLRGANLTNATLTSAVIEQAYFGNRVPLTADDPCIAPPEWCEYDPQGCGEDVGRCSDIESQDPDCLCRTQLNGVNLNGSNLVAARFDGADLFEASFLGVTVGPTDDRPIFMPSDCRPEVTDACVNLCPLINACGDHDGGPLDEDDQFDCVDWTAQCRVASEQTLFLEVLSLDHITCIMRTWDQANWQSFQQDNQQCFGFRGIFEGCFADIAVDPNAPPLMSRCTFDNIKTTWALNDSGQLCDQDESEENWTCCPDARISDHCSTAKTSFVDSRLSGAQMTAVTLNQVVLTGAELEGASLQSSVISDSVFRGVNLAGAQLESADLYNLSLNEINLENANLTEAHLRRLSLRDSNLSNTQFFNAELDNCDVSGSYNLAESPMDFRGGRMIGSPFGFDGRLTILNASWPNANFEEAEFELIDFAASTFTGADFSKAFMNNVAFEDSPRDGLVGDMSGVDFNRATLINVRFNKVNLTDAIFDYINFPQDPLNLRSNDSSLSNIIANGSSFRHAIFQGVRINGGEYNNADFSSAHFGEAMEISATDFNTANFKYAEFNGPTLAFVLFNNSDLSQSTFHNIDGENITLRDSLLQTPNLDDPDVDFRVSISDSELRGLTFDNNTGGPIFQNNNIENWDVDTSDLSGALFRGTTILGGTVLDSNLSEIDLDADSVIEDVLFQGSIDADGLYSTQMTAAFGPTTFIENDFIRVDFSDSVFDGTHFLQRAEDGSLSPGTFLCSTCKLNNTRLSNLVLDDLIFQFNTEAQSIRFTNVNVIGLTNFHDADINSIRVDRVSKGNGIYCGSRLNARFNNATVTNGTLIGVCDLSADMRGADVNSTYFCGDDFDQIHNYVGVPRRSGVCPSAPPLCPDDPACAD